MNEHWQSIGKVVGILAVACGVTAYILIARAQSGWGGESALGLVLMLTLSYAPILPLLIYVHYQLPAAGRTRALAQVGLVCALGTWPILIALPFVTSVRELVVDLGGHVVPLTVFLSAWMLLGCVYLSQKGLWAWLGVFHIAWGGWLFHLATVPYSVSPAQITQLTEGYLIFAGLSLFTISTNDPKVTEPFPKGG